MQHVRSSLAELSVETRLILWHGALTMHEYTVDSVACMLRYSSGITSSIFSDLLFKGKVMVLSGNFRHVLLFVDKGV
jgi:hypothetical protein